MLDSDRQNIPARVQLAEMLIQSADAPAALAVIQEGNEEKASQQKLLRLEAVSSILAGSSTQPRQLAEKAVLLAPWEKENWVTLAYTRQKEPVSTS